jgi:hypothetical protein
MAAREPPLPSRDDIPVTNDRIRYLPPEEVEKIIQKISELPPKD